MTSFPKPNIYIYTFLFIIIYFSIDFYFFKKDTFIQFKFNWKKEETLNKYTNTYVDSISYNYIKLQMESLTLPSTNNTFVFKSNIESYYFRPMTINNTIDGLEFKHLIWLKNSMPKIKDSGELLEIDLPFIQKGNYTLNSIGGTFLTYNWANYFRKELSKATNAVFVGNNKDLFSYPHDAIFMANSTSIANNIKSTKVANKYILFLGDQDVTLSWKQIQTNWKNILEELNSRDKTNEIIVLLLPPSNIENINIYRKQYNLLLLKLDEEYNVSIINTYGILNKNIHLVHDNYPNKQGYEIIVKKIIEKLDEKK